MSTTYELCARNLGASARVRAVLDTKFSVTVVLSSKDLPRCGATTIAHDAAAGGHTDTLDLLVGRFGLDILVRFIDFRQYVFMGLKMAS